MVLFFGRFTLPSATKREINAVMEGHYAVLVVRISIAIRISTLGVTVVVVSVVVFRVVSRARQIWHKGGGSRAGTAPKGATKARRHR